MDRSLGTTAQPRIQDVTPQILKTHMIYGGSDYTAAHRHASGRSLNYDAGNSINKPEMERVSVSPYTLTYKDSVGLFGAENHFIKVDLEITGDVVLLPYEEPYWERVTVTEAGYNDPYYDDAYSDLNFTYNPTPDIDGYFDAALLRDVLPSYENKVAYFSIELINKGTGNKYNDAWLDVRLYTKGKQEHPYDKMYVRSRDDFYIGFHARNTRRLPYNVECIIGAEFIPYDEIADKRLIMKR